MKLNASGILRSRIYRTVVNFINKTTRRGNYWYWLESPEVMDGIDISTLICPLRYDVLVRRDFFAFYAARRELFLSDFNTFLSFAKQSSYYTWFVKSEAVRRMWHDTNDAKTLDIKFAARVRESATLYESIMKHGFVQKYPIILRTAEHLLPPTADRLAPPTGKFVTSRYFIADGCHRLALLMIKGYTVLPFKYSRIQCFREFSPFDSTSLLVRSLPIEPPAYFAFLSSKYCIPFIFKDKDDFTGYIRENRPDCLQEVLSVIRTDGFETGVSA